MRQALDRRDRTRSLPPKGIPSVSTAAPRARIFASIRTGVRAWCADRVRRGVLGPRLTDARRLTANGLNGNPPLQDIERAESFLYPLIRKLGVKMVVPWEDVYALARLLGRPLADGLLPVLKNAHDLATEGWSYASPYFREKWEADRRLTEIAAAIAAQEPTPHPKDKT